MIFGKSLLLKWRGRRAGNDAGLVQGHEISPVYGKIAVNIARDQLKLRVLECGSAMIYERHPTVEVAAGLVFSNVQHVIRAPRKIRRHIGRFYSVPSRA